jgi:hypothetical protein
MPGNRMNGMNPMNPSQQSPHPQMGNMPPNSSMNPVSGGPMMQNNSNAVNNTVNANNNSPTTLPNVPNINNSNSNNTNNNNNNSNSNNSLPGSNNNNNTNNNSSNNNSSNINNNSNNISNNGPNTPTNASGSITNTTNSLNMSQNNQMNPHQMAGGQMMQNMPSGMPGANNMMGNNNPTMNMGNSVPGMYATGPKPMPVSAGKIYPADTPMVFNPQNPNAPPIYPCGVCHKEVHDNDQGLLCESGCNFWFHR